MQHEMTVEQISNDYTYSATETYSLLVSCIFTFFLIIPVTVVPKHTHNYCMQCDMSQRAAHQLDPCGSHGPRHTQQYSQRHVEHTM